MKLGLLLVFLAAGAMVFRWWKLRRVCDSPRVEAVAPRAPSPTPRTDSADAADAAVQPSRTGFARRDADRAAASEAVEIEPWPARGFRLLVVDRETGAPQAGAIVTRIDPYWNPDVIAADVLDVLGRLDRWGRRYRADEDGFVRVPPSSTALEIYARSEDRLGHRWVEPYDTAASEAGAPVRIEVAPSRTLRVQTVDARGTPRSGFPLLVVSDMSERSLGNGVVTSRAPDGIVEIPGADLLFDDDASPPGLEIGLNLAQIAPRTVHVTREQLDGPPVRFVVPDTGRIEARLVDREGRRVERDTEVWLSLSRPASAATADLPAVDEEGLDVTRACFVAGVATIEPIALGLKVDFDDWLGEWGSAAVTAMGPTRAGETTQLVLTVGDPRIAFTGTLVDRTGVPIASRAFDASFVLRRDGNSLGDGACATTAKDGSFRLYVQGFVRGAWSSGAVEFLVRHDLGGVEWKGRATVRPDVAASGGSLGTIELAPCGRVVSGIVVDDVDQPIAHAAVWLVLRDADPRDEAAPLRNLWSRSGDDGRFEIHGDPGDAALAVTGGMSKMRAPAVPFARGATDVRVVVPRFGAIVGRVLLEPELPLDVVRGVLSVRSDRGESILERIESGPDRSGTIAWQALPSGLGHVRLEPGWRCLDSGRDVLLEIDGIRIEPGQRSTDPRLDAIDLRGRFHWTRLIAIDASGKAVGDGDVVQVVDGRAEGTRLDLERGEAQLCTLAEWPEVVIRVPGFRTARVPLVAPETRVVLRRGPLVRLRLAGAETSLPPGIELSFTLERVTPDDEELDDLAFHDLGPPQADGRRIARLAAPGRYALHCMVHWEGTGDFDVVSDDESAGLFIEVADTEEPQSFDLELPVAAILAMAKEQSDE